MSFNTVKCKRGDLTLSSISVDIVQKYGENGLMSEFGPRLKQSIEELKLNQRQVALRSGIDYPMLIKIGKGAQNATLETLVKLLRVAELRPFVICELKHRAPELFTQETLEIIEKAANMLDTHTPEELKLIYDETKAKRKDVD